MNPEDEEFLESDQIIISKESQYWKRNEVINDITLSILTLAYGGTKYSGRKLYDASIILAKWIKNHVNNNNLNNNHSTTTTTTTTTDNIFDNFNLDNKYVIELGCGSTGIPGMISIALGASHVHFCDIDSQAISELTNNLVTNLPILEKYRINSSSIIENESKNFFTISNVDWSQLNLSNNNNNQNNQSILILASEIVYDAIEVELLVACIHRLLSHNGSLLFCQSRYGRGRIQEFIELMTNSPYNYRFTEFNYHLYMNEEEKLQYQQYQQQYQQQQNQQQNNKFQILNDKDINEYIFGMFY